MVDSLEEDWKDCQSRVSKQLQDILCRKKCTLETCNYLSMEPLAKLRKVANLLAI